ncbi:Neuropeptide-Like Protein [Caenorhabditis elegans]|uniref:Neuropeptide-Like Protein n=1 Tax=Caenorhabditis elegans TaxID=6239 RepID=O17707_CAEEL|nr:Neuropeptide-Like Protein [Caenorhabditis elegans]CAB05463.1 Neuropeptide-Like Protein [Caenorhabditis elegans]|eukprot:NP_493163.1 Neuropeptide-Like Protein [Caenorhabditis elegans]
MKLLILFSLFAIFFGVIALDSPIPEFYSTGRSTRVPSHRHRIPRLGKREVPNFQADNVPEAGGRVRRYVGPPLKLVILI